MRENSQSTRVPLEIQYQNGGGSGLLEIDEKPGPPNSSENKTGFFVGSCRESSNWSAWTDGRASRVLNPRQGGDCAETSRDLFPIILLSYIRC